MTRLNVARMAEFRITFDSASKRLTYKGPFGPADIHHGFARDGLFTVEVRGPNVPDAKLSLGANHGVARAVRKTKRGSPIIGLIDREQVLLRSEYRLPAFVLDMTLVATARERELRLRLKVYRAWEARRADGTVLAVPVRKPSVLLDRYWSQRRGLDVSPVFEVPGEGWLDDRADAFDVATILLLRSVGLAYKFLTHPGPV